MKQAWTDFVEDLTELAVAMVMTCLGIIFTLAIFVGLVFAWFWVVDRFWK